MRFYAPAPRARGASRAAPSRSGKAELASPIELLAAEELRRLRHLLGHFHAEGATTLARITGDARIGAHVKRAVVLAHGIRHLCLHDCEVVELVDCGDVDALGARRTVAAVRALPVVGVARRTGEHTCVVALLGPGRLVRHGVGHVLRRGEADHDARHRRASERVVDALHRRERDAERRGRGIEQAAARVALHDRDARARLLGECVELRAVGVYAVEALLAVITEEVIEVIARGHHVERRVHGEEHHLDARLGRRELGNRWIVGGKADVSDGARLLEFLHVAPERPGHDLLELLDLVHVMDHAEVHVVGMEARQQVLEGGLDLIEVARAYVLLALPRGAKVPLNGPAVSTAELPERVAQVGAARGVGHPAVEYVDARVLAGARDSERFLERAVHPFAAKADLADLEPRAAKRAVLHDALPLLAKQTTAPMPAASSATSTNIGADNAWATARGLRCFACPSWCKYRCWCGQQLTGPL